MGFAGRRDYPALKRLGFEMTALRRMTAGIAFSGLAWIVVGGMQLVLDGGEAFSITWQVLPYALLTLGEVLVSTTGLEFARRREEAARKPIPPRYLGGYGSCDDS